MVSQPRQPSKVSTATSSRVLSLALLTRAKAKHTRRRTRTSFKSHGISGRRTKASWTAKEVEEEAKVETKDLNPAIGNAMDVVLTSSLLRILASNVEQRSQEAEAEAEAAMERMVAKEVIKVAKGRMIKVVAKEGDGKVTMKTRDVVAYRHK